MVFSEMCYDLPYTGKLWLGKNWRIVSYLPIRSSPIFTDTPKMYLAYTLTLARLPNFSSPMAFFLYGLPTAKCVWYVLFLKLWLYYIVLYDYSELETDAFLFDREISVVFI